MFLDQATDLGRAPGCEWRWGVLLVVEVTGTGQVQGRAGGDRHGWSLGWARGGLLRGQVEERLQ